MCSWVSFCMMCCGLGCGEDTISRIQREGDDPAFIALSIMTVLLNALSASDLCFAGFVASLGCPLMLRTEYD
jgi:hypothetical protein